MIEAPARPIARIRFATLDTPIGEMLAVASDDALHLLEFTDTDRTQVQLTRLARRLGTTPSPGSNAAIEQTDAELRAYYAGDLRDFKVALAPAGTPFQQAVWKMLTGIAYGTTRSYGEQARHIGQPTATRAVASANGDNPIAVIIPCHRVIGANGKLTGYGGGLWRKQYLLDHERGGALPLGGA
ncbi:MAG: methylated-DNA--[protein]-cysteine S-methyltransferase [Longimicrobiales bacterium]